ncbi:L,D-transpeptidase family protein [Roseobacter sp. SK209-2-6]|uniref:L,D-transpeptidase family protein n=1 Tax=Roseobacter sp. SK209-2-6 TaxID=388739 RepID=UPI001E5C9D4F|nr:L,D-transpeptidase family protein [Roseobacter sp. SK209-2-6]
MTAALGWGLWHAFAPAPSIPTLVEDAQRVDQIVIDKSARRLLASRQGETVLEFDIALGFEPVGDKAEEGDGKTPEGIFRVNRRNANSSFHLSLGLDYPQAEDLQRAEDAGIDPGGDIFIHGQPNAVGGALTLPGDWTAGCIAISNSEMERLWQLVDIGTKVEIRP